MKLPIQILNPGLEAATNVSIELMSDYPAVEVLEGQRILPTLAAGSVTASAFQVRFTAGEGDFERVRLQFRITAAGNEVKQHEDVAVPPATFPHRLKL